VAKRIVLETLV